MTVPSSTGQHYPPLGVGSIIADGDKGDITVSSSGTVWTIDNDAVTFAKMQNIATDRVLGRDTASSGDVEELTLTQVLDFVGSAAQGDILYRGAAAWARLGAGTSGKFLQTLGAAANPQWATPGAGGAGVDPLGWYYEEWGRAFFPNQNAAVAWKNPRAYTLNGTSVTANDSDGAYLTVTTPAATSGSVLQNTAGTLDTTIRAWSTEMVINLKTTSDIADMRVWSGLFSVDPTGTDTPTGHLMAFRYSTGASDANWQCVTRDGSTQNTVDSGVVVATDTKYSLRIISSPTEVAFYINDTLVVTTSTNLPGSTTTIGENVSLTTLTNAFKSIKWSRFWLRHRQ